VEEVDSFLHWFKKLSTEEKEQYILGVLHRYGIESEQFYFVIQAFILFVMLRHRLYWDDETFQNAFLSIYEKLRFWEKDKGNLLSFIYSLVRDKVSQEKYWRGVFELRYKEGFQDDILVISEEIPVELCCNERDNRPDFN
jgi:hypothetical protein